MLLTSSSQPFHACTNLLIFMGSIVSYQSFQAMQFLCRFHIFIKTLITIYIIWEPKRRRSIYSALRRAHAFFLPNPYPVG